MIHKCIDRTTTRKSGACFAGAVLLAGCLWSALAQSASAQQRPEQSRPQDQAREPADPRAAPPRSPQQRDAHTGELVSVRNGSIAITIDGENQHTHRVTPQTQITVNGKPAQISELRPGDRITVTADANNVAQRIEAERRRPQADNRTDSQPRKPGEAAAAGAGAAWLGVFLENSEDGGVLIGQTYSGGPADEAGIRSGDRLLKIGGQDVSSPDQASQAVRALSPNQQVEVVVLRNDRERTIEVTLGRRNRFLPGRQQSTDGGRSFSHYLGDSEHDLIFMQHKDMAEQHERIERMLRDLQRQLQEVQNDIRDLKAQRNQ